MASNKSSVRLKIPLLKLSMQMQTTEPDFLAARNGRATPELHSVRDVTTNYAEAAIALNRNLENSGISAKQPQVLEPARNDP